MKEFREWFSLLVTVIILPVMGWLNWSVNQKIDLKVTTLQSELKDRYVEKSDFRLLVEREATDIRETDHQLTQIRDIITRRYSNKVSEQ